MGRRKYVFASRQEAEDACKVAADERFAAEMIVRYLSRGEHVDADRTMTAHDDGDRRTFRIRLWGATRADNGFVLIEESKGEMPVNERCLSWMALMKEREHMSGMLRHPEFLALAIAIDRVAVDSQRAWDVSRERTA